MLKLATTMIGVVTLSTLLVAQTPPVLGDRTSPLRELGGEGNSGISNAVLREQSEVRALRLVIQPGGTRAMHSHDDVRFHLFVPITRVMTLELEGESVEVQPWHPYFLAGGTRHGFHNGGPVAGEVMEIFIR